MNTQTLDFTPFQQLADDATLLILSITQPLEDGPAHDVLERVKQLFLAWHRDGKIRNASGAFYFERSFLVLAWEPTGATLSGCTRDQLTHLIQHLESELGFSLLSTPRFAVLTGERVTFMSQKEFRAKRQAGEITDHSPVFDHLIKTLGEFRGGKFMLPVVESWYAPIGGKSSFS